MSLSWEEENMKVSLVHDGITKACNERSMELSVEWMKCMNTGQLKDFINGTNRMKQPFCPMKMHYFEGKTFSISFNDFFTNLVFSYLKRV